MKIELTIESSYLPNWGIWEGIRELIQNAKDADQKNFPLKIHHDNNNTLTISNEGALLSHKDLLLGHTTKLNDDSQIGMYGEGLKLGILALVREDCNIIIHSGKETWRPFLSMSKKFKTKVLTFDIKKNKTEYNGVKVKVSGISLEQWNEYLKRFLFFQADCYEFPNFSDVGSILKKEYKGKCYVKGIFVQTKSNLEYGYNFTNINVDRDRRMIDGWDLNYNIISIWKNFSKTKLSFPIIYNMLKNNIKDLSAISSYDVNGFSTSCLDYINNKFIDEYGKDVIPVKDISQAKDVQFLGKLGIVFPEQFCLMVLKGEGFNCIKKDLEEQIISIHNFDDLYNVEKENLNFSINMINRSDVNTIFLSDMQICSFKTDKILGLYQDKKVKLSKKILKDKYLTLRVLIHEVAHKVDGDGTKGHTNEIEEIWTGIFKSMRL